MYYIISSQEISESVDEVAVSLLDVSATIATHFGTQIAAADGVRDLRSILSEPVQKDRVVFSEYHAAGAVSGAFMLRKGAWKLIHYVGFPDELFHLEDDPQECTNRAEDPACIDILKDLHQELRKICEPDVVDEMAFADQAALIAHHGGREAALKLGAAGATPPPESAP